MAGSVCEDDGVGLRHCGRVGGKGCGEETVPGWQVVGCLNAVVERIAVGEMWVEEW